MSTSTESPDGKVEQPVGERIEELRDIEDDLKTVAASDTPYAEYAQRYLDALEEHDG